MKKCYTLYKFPRMGKEPGVVMEYIFVGQEPQPGDTIDDDKGQRWTITGRHWTADGEMHLMVNQSSGVVLAGRQ